MADRERLSVQVDTQMADELRAITAEQNARLSDIIRELLRLGISHFDRPRKPRSRIVENPFGDE
jgi:metal-responsive CopG/Arc/MetJ family transcriptional regulator